MAFVIKRIWHHTAVLAIGDADFNKPTSSTMRSPNKLYMNHNIKRSS